MSRFGADDLIRQAAREDYAAAGAADVSARMAHRARACELRKRARLVRADERGWSDGADFASDVGRTDAPSRHAI